MRKRPCKGNPWFLYYCRCGIASLSVIYLLTGALTAMAALGLGGQKVDQRDVLPYLLRQPLGRISLSMLAVGIGGYVLWRLVQAWKDPAGFGAGPKGICIRGSYLVSAGLYASMILYALRMVWDGRPLRDPERAPFYARFLLHQPYGHHLIRAVALTILIVGLVQFFRAFTERFRRQIPDPKINRRHSSLIRWTGRFGFTARGVVLVVVAWLFFEAGEHADPREAGGIARAWDFLGTGPLGPALLATVACSLSIYGIFLAVKAWGLQDDLRG